MRDTSLLAFTRHSRASFEPLTLCFGLRPGELMERQQNALAPAQRRFNGVAEPYANLLVND